MIGEIIRKARKAAGVSQKELAERLQVYQKDISRWENGERTPTMVAALPSGNITGEVGCLVIAAVCAFAGAKGKAEQQADKKPAPHVAPASTNERIAETIRTKLVGVTYDNEDGENRQDILSSMTGSEEIEVEKYIFNGEPAAYVKCGNKVLGNLAAELAKDLEGKYPDARYTAEILEISGGGGGTHVRLQH